MSWLYRPTDVSDKRRNGDRLREDKPRRLLQTPESRLWMAVLLLGIAETDRIRINPGPREDRQAMVEQARRWKDSWDFDDVCLMAGVPVDVAERITPEQAKAGYQLLIGDMLGKTDRVDEDTIDEQPQDTIV